MDTTQIAVTVAGAVLIAAVQLFFFAGRKEKSGKAEK